ncbi:membrane-spanning 4-domains subfamily A member 4D-like isoform X2 [Dendropsophus ebraccatus]
MDLPGTPSFGPLPMTQQQRNIFPVVPNGNQEFYRSILKAQPKILGVVQSILVILQLALGAILTSSLGNYQFLNALSGINYWGSLIYLFSGAMSVLAELKPSLLLVKTLLASNVLCCLISFIEFCLICNDINGVNNSDYWWDCYSILKVVRISLTFLFIATVVQLSISGFLVWISWNSLKHNSDFAAEVSVVNNEYRYVMTP